MRLHATVSALLPIGKLDRPIRDANFEMGAGLTVFTQFDCAAVQGDEFMGDGEAKTCAIGASRALERRKQVLARLCRQARPSIFNADDCRRAYAATGNDDTARTLVMACQGLRRVAHQIGDDAEELVGVSIGIAQIQPGDTLATLHSRADAALYRAKQTGRGRVEG